ncbi:major capsid family protein [Floridanema evergladense]|uniref:Major capsid family protein n=1 Tax=Floridaenema evergladense BLCC-F167 TaxID=3153639 RepID=A0ABV4WCY7_9CYAN
MPETLDKFRMDEESLLFAQRSLTGIATKIYEKDYSAQFKAANGEICPVRVWNQYADKRWVEILELDVFGMAEVIADYSKGGPRVGVVGRRQTYPIRTIGDHAGWSWEEVLLAKGANIPLEQKSLGATRTAFEAKWNHTCYHGDADYGLPGLKTSNLPRLVSPTTFAAASTPDALLALLHEPVNSVSTNSNNMEVPKKIVLPSKQHSKIATTMRSTQGEKTVLKAFLEAQADLGQVTSVVKDDNLKGFGTNGEDCMLVLPEDEDAIVFALAMDYTLLPVQQVNLEYVQHAVGRIIGAVVIRMLSGLIVEGI